MPLLLRRPRLWLLAAPLPLALLMYLPYGFFLSQYAAAVVPSMGAWLVLGAWELVTAAVPGRAPPPRGRGGGRRLRPAPPAAPRGAGTAGRFAAALLGVGGVLVLCTRGIPGLANVSTERWYQVPQLRKIDAALAAIPGRAVVFISPPSMVDPVEAEATYNLDVAFSRRRPRRPRPRPGRPQRRARRLLRPKIQPDRDVYRFDRDGDTLSPIGQRRRPRRPAG